MPEVSAQTSSARPLLGNRGGLDQFPWRWGLRSSAGDFDTQVGEQPAPPVVDARVEAS